MQRKNHPVNKSILLLIVVGITAVLSTAIFLTASPVIRNNNAKSIDIQTSKIEKANQQLSSDVQGQIKFIDSMISTRRGDFYTIYAIAKTDSSFIPVSVEITNVDDEGFTSHDLQLKQNLGCFRPKQLNEDSNDIYNQYVVGGFTAYATDAMSMYVSASKPISLVVRTQQGKLYRIDDIPIQGSCMRGFD